MQTGSGEQAQVADKEAEGGAAMDAVISYQIMAISWTEPTSAVKTPVPDFVVPALSFPEFAKLSTETRLAIWKLTITPRALCFQKGSGKPPAAMFSCREAWVEIGKEYIFLNTRNLEPALCKEIGPHFGICINWDTDIVHISPIADDGALDNSDCLISLVAYETVQKLFAPWLSQVKKIAFDVENTDLAGNEMEASDPEELWYDFWTSLGDTTFDEVFLVFDSSYHLQMERLVRVAEGDMTKIEGQCIGSCLGSVEYCETYDRLAGGEDEGGDESRDENEDEEKWCNFFHACLAGDGPMHIMRNMVEDGKGEKRNYTSKEHPTCSTMRRWL